MNLYLCTDEKDEFLFKEILNDTVIEYELLVQELAKKIGVQTLPFLQKITFDNKKGLLMSFLKDSQLLCHSTINNVFGFQIVSNYFRTQLPHPPVKLPRQLLATADNS